MQVSYLQYHPMEPHQASHGLGISLLLGSDQVELLRHNQRGPQSKMSKTLTPSIPRVEGSWQASQPEATLVGAIALHGHTAVPFRGCCRGGQCVGDESACEHCAGERCGGGLSERMGKQSE